MWSKYVSNNIGRDFRLTESAYATVSRKNFNGKFTSKNCFLRSDILCYHNTDPDIGSLKSLHILFDKYLGHMLVKFEQNLMVQKIQNF